MRLTFVAAVACLIAVTIPGDANSSAVRISKPNGTWSAYLDDRAACLNATQPPPQVYLVGHGAGSLGSEAERKLRADRYWDCMIAAGYRDDPNGFRANPNGRRGQIFW